MGSTFAKGSITVMSDYGSHDGIIKRIKDIQTADNLPNLSLVRYKEEYYFGGRGMGRPVIKNAQMGMPLVCVLDPRPNQQTDWADYSFDYIARRINSKVKEGEVKRPVLMLVLEYPEEAESDAEQTEQTNQNGTNKKKKVYTNNEVAARNDFIALKTSFQSKFRVVKVKGDVKSVHEDDQLASALDWLYVEGGFKQSMTREVPAEFIYDNTIATKTNNDTKQLSSTPAFAKVSVSAEELNLQIDNNNYDNMNNRLVVTDVDDGVVSAA